MGMHTSQHRCSCAPRAAKARQRWTRCQGTSGGGTSSRTGGRAATAPRAARRCPRTSADAVQGIAVSAAHPNRDSQDTLPVGAHLDADGVKQPLVHTPNAGNFADGEVVRERFDCGGLEVELELSVGFILCFRCERDHLRGKYGRRTLSEQIWETVSVGLENYV